MPKKNRVAIYSQLFKDGVCVVKKDPMMKKHGEIDVPNLHVMQTMKSLNSREYVRETFSWQYYYYYLTDEGIEYLRGFLNLPSTIKVCFSISIVFATLPLHSNLITRRELDNGASFITALLVPLNFDARADSTCAI